MWVLSEIWDTLTTHRRRSFGHRCVTDKEEIVFAWMKGMRFVFGGNDGMINLFVYVLSNHLMDKFLTRRDKCYMEWKIVDLTR